MPSIHLIAKCRAKNLNSKRCTYCRDRFICFTETGTVNQPPTTNVFEVPNDEVGRKFISDLRKYINKDIWRVTIRGRHPYRKSLGINKYQNVPLSKADWFAVYLEIKDNSKAWGKIIVKGT